MKSIFLMLFLILYDAFAAPKLTNKKSTEQKCAKEARRALLLNAQQFAENTDTDATFEFFNGATVGDAGASVEINVYKNKNTKVLSKVELNGEMCTLRSIETLN